MQTINPDYVVSIPNVYERLHTAQRNETILLICMCLFILASFILAIRLFILQTKEENRRIRLRLFLKQMFKTYPTACLMYPGKFECPYKNNKGRCINHILRYFHY